MADKQANEIAVEFSCEYVYADIFASRELCNCSVSVSGAIRVKQ